MLTFNQFFHLTFLINQILSFFKINGLNKHPVGAAMDVFGAPLSLIGDGKMDAYIHGCMNG